MAADNGVRASGRLDVDGAGWGAAAICSGALGKDLRRSGDRTALSLSPSRREFPKTEARLPSPVLLDAAPGYDRLRDSIHAPSLRERVDPGASTAGIPCALDVLGGVAERTEEPVVEHRSARFGRMAQAAHVELLIHEIGAHILPHHFA